MANCWMLEFLLLMASQEWSMNLVDYCYIPKQNSTSHSPLSIGIIIIKRYTGLLAADCQREGVVAGLEFYLDFTRRLSYMVWFFLNLL